MVEEDGGQQGEDLRELGPEEGLRREGGDGVEEVDDRGRRVAAYLAAADGLAEKCQ